MIRPGPTLVGLGLAMVGLAALAAVWRPAAWGVLPLVAVGLSLAAVDIRFLRRHKGALQVARDAPVCVARGKPFGMRLQVTNRGDARLCGTLRDGLPVRARPVLWQQAFALEAGARTDLHYDVAVSERGLHSFGPVWVRLQGRCGALERHETLDDRTEIKVLPESAVDRDEELEKRLRAETRSQEPWTRTRLRGEGLEFESIGRFHDGDDLRRIDWRASARHSRLMVRRYQLEQHRDVMILVDCGRLMGADAGTGTKLDCAVDGALMLGQVALAKGDRCGLGLFGDRVLGYLPPQSGPRAYGVLLESLYKVAPTWQETHFGDMFAMLQVRQQKRALVIVLSDIVDAETTGRFRSALATLSKRHVVVFVALQTPLLAAALGTAAGSLADAARQAVVLRLLRDREKALHSLSRSGLFVLDREPQEVTVPLINQYIKIRERNLL